MFKKRHYIAVAKIIRDERTDVNMYTFGGEEKDAALEAILRIEHDFTKLFRKDSADFDPYRFYRACLTGAEEETE